MIKIHKDNGKRFKFASHINEFLIPREKTSSSETFLVIIEPNKSTHLHKHDETEQTFFVTNGKGEVWTKEGGKLKLFCTLQPGDLLFIPVGSWHQIRCLGKERLEYICFNSFPKGFPPEEGTSLSHAEQVVKLQQNENKK